MEPKGSGSASSRNTTPPTPVTDPRSAASRKKIESASSKGDTVIINVEDGQLIAPGSEPPPTRKNVEMADAASKKRPVSERANSRRTVQTKRPENNLIELTYITLDIGELERLLKDPSIDTTYDPVKPPGTTDSRDEEINLVWTDAPRKLAKDNDFALIMQKLLDRKLVDYYVQEPKTQEIAKEESELIIRVLLAYSGVHARAFDMVYQSVNKAASVRIGYNIGKKSITALVHRLHFLTGKISLFSEEAAKDAEAVKQEADKALAKKEAAEKAEKAADEKKREDERNQKKRDEADRKAVLEDAERSAATVEAARAEVSRRAKADGAAAELAMAVAHEKLRKEADEARRLKKDAESAAVEKLRLEQDLRVQEEDRLRKEKEVLEAEANLRTQQQDAIDSATTAAEKKRLEDEENKRITEKRARVKEAKEEAERKREALEEEQKKNAATIADIAQKTKKTNEARIAADKNAAHEDRALQVAREKEETAKESLKEASRTRDGITLESIAIEETALEWLEEVYNLRVLTDKVVKLATFFVDDAGNYVAYGQKLRAIVSTTSAEIAKATAEKKTSKKTSIRFHDIMIRLTGNFVKFAAYITETNNKIDGDRNKRSFEQRMHVFKVDIILALVFILSIERRNIKELSGDPYDTLDAQVVSIGDKARSKAFHDKQNSDASDATTLIEFARTLCDIAKHYVISAQTLLSEKQTLVTQARLALKERQDKRAIGHEQARLAMMARRYLAPLHPKDRPNYVPVIVAVLGRASGKRSHRIITVHRTMANKTIGMFDRNQSRERNYGYAIHLGRQAPVRVITQTYTSGPIEAGSYLLCILVQRENVAMVFDMGSGILRLPDNNAESLFRHGEARIPSLDADGNADSRAGVFEIFVSLSGKPAADGILPIKSILFHRWSISLPDEEDIHQVIEVDFSMLHANNEGKTVNVYKPSDATSGDDENGSAESGGEDASASDSDGETNRSHPLTSSASSNTKGTTPSSGPRPLAPPKSVSPATGPSRSQSPPPRVPPSATAEAGPLPLVPPPPPPPPPSVVQETADIAKKPVVTSAPSADILSYDINGWGSW